ncbi:MAG: arylamine N-acetyltransferase [Coriobacteriales bacterium]|nr:arylamine N-acetyltransferase [Coriobacteriales bacterium]
MANKDNDAPSPESSFAANGYSPSTLNPLSVKNSWNFIDGDWYYFDSEGNKLIGLQDIDGKSYFFNAVGVRQILWQKVGNDWYYFSFYSGVMGRNVWIQTGANWYYVGADGKRFSGGLADLNGQTYLFDANGIRQTLWHQVGSDWYYFSFSSGVMGKNVWIKTGDNWYRVNENGARLYSGWFVLNNKTYYLHPSTGIMATGWRTLGSDRYYFGGVDDGEMRTGNNVIAPGNHPGRSDFAQDGRWLNYSSTGDTWLDGQLTWIIGYCNYDLRSCFNFVASYGYITQDEYPSGNWAVPYAKQMIQNNGGNCYRYAALFSMLAWYLGYETNVVSGWVPTYYGPAPHGWVELYIDGNTYVCDSCFQHNILGYNWYMISYAGAPISYGRW